MRPVMARLLATLFLEQRPLSALRPGDFLVRLGDILQAPELLPVLARRLLQRDRLGRLEVLQGGLVEPAHGEMPVPRRAGPSADQPAGDLRAANAFDVVEI